jgi:hypothetical protein
MGIKVGRCEISDCLVFSVPENVILSSSCRIYRKVDYDRIAIAPSLNAARRSCQLETDALYRISNVPSTDRNDNYYIATHGGIAQCLSQTAYDDAVEYSFPERAAQVRLEKERTTQRAAQRTRIMARGGRRALLEKNVVAAATIEQFGQAESEYPKLTGTPKQIAFAIDIRAEYALRHPGDRSLKTATRAQYWISNHKRILGTIG